MKGFRKIVYTWQHLGNRKRFSKVISRITSIPCDILHSYPDFQASRKPYLILDVDDIKSPCQSHNYKGPKVINHQLQRYSVTQRMSRAAKRKWTRAEDTAYSLLGIFDIGMPLLYGDGYRACLRLQQETFRLIDDHSLLTWMVTPGAVGVGLRTACSQPHRWTFLRQWILREGIPSSTIRGSVSQDQVQTHMVPKQPEENFKP